MKQTVEQLLASQPCPRTEKAVWHTKDGVRVVDYEVACAMERLLGLYAALLDAVRDEVDDWTIGEDLAKDIDDARQMAQAEQT